MIILNKARRRKTFHEIVYPQLGFVYNMALRLSGNPYDAEDLSQEVCAIAFERLPQLKDPAKCRFWLLSILRNKYLRSLERRRPELLDTTDDESYTAVLEALPTDEDPESLLVGKETAETVQQCLHDLPEKYKTPLALFYTEEWSYKEIASGLDLPIGTVMSRIARGRELVKKALLRRRAREAAGQLIRPPFDGTAPKA
jgi:RNA polymerase sigma-70 factor (ECF subfamily)